MEKIMIYFFTFTTFIVNHVILHNFWQGTSILKIQKSKQVRIYFSNCQRIKLMSRYHRIRIRVARHIFLWNVTVIQTFL